jgi:hypothetical protein
MLLYVIVSSAGRTFDLTFDPGGPSRAWIQALRLRVSGVDVRRRKRRRIKRERKRGRGRGRTRTRWTLEL